MSYSEELLLKSKGKSMTLKDRQELREALRFEQEQENRQKSLISNTVKNFKDDSFNPLDMPRHRWLGKNNRYEECPICRRIRNYDTRYISDHNDIQNHPEDFCMKPHIHNEKAFNMMIVRGRVDLDGKRK